jgi:hypothetical protein
MFKRRDRVWEALERHGEKAGRSRENGKSHCKFWWSMIGLGKRSRQLKRVWTTSYSEGRMEGGDSGRERGEGGESGERGRRVPEGLMDKGNSWDCG